MHSSGGELHISPKLRLLSNFVPAILDGTPRVPPGSSPVKPPDADRSQPIVVILQGLQGAVGHRLAGREQGPALASTRFSSAPRWQAVSQLTLVSPAEQQRLPLGVGTEHDVAGQHDLMQFRHAEPVRLRVPQAGRRSG